MDDDEVERLFILATKENPDGERHGQKEKAWARVASRLSSDMGWKEGSRTVRQVKERIAKEIGRFRMYFFPLLD